MLEAREDACRLVTEGHVITARYAPMFPSPRTERVSAGHLVAVATAPDGADVVVWRWYDAVVLGEDRGLLRLWEPAHGEVDARPRLARHGHEPGTRAYLSAGLPGAEWWVAGPAVSRAEDAQVELDEVARLYTERGLWNAALECEVAPGQPE